jgi:hypothetical protein
VRQGQVNRQSRSTPRALSENSEVHQFRISRVPRGSNPRRQVIKICCTTTMLGTRACRRMGLNHLPPRLETPVLYQ